MRESLHRYESLSELLAAAETERAYGAYTSSEARDHEGGWHGTESYAAMLNLARNGWSDVRPMVERIANVVQPKIRETDRATVRWHSDVVGAVPSVPRALAGHPKAMRKPVRHAVAAHGRVVSILVNVGAVASISADAIQARGAAVVALIETLSTMGHTVELWAENTVRSKGRKNGDAVTMIVRVHRASDHLDADQIMFTLAHPAMLRRLMFRVRETFTGWEGFAGTGGYGSSDPELHAARLINPDILINGIDSRAPEITDPAAWVVSALKGLGLWEEA